MKEIAERFNKLPFKDRCMLVSSYGKTLMITNMKDFHITLYEVDGAFIEVWYNVYLSQIDMVRMPSYSQLDIHLKSIRLTYED